MDGENIISWNVENWITVVLMAFIGFALLGLISQTLKKAMGGKVSQTDNVYYAQFGK